MIAMSRYAFVLLLLALGCDLARAAFKDGRSSDYSMDYDSWTNHTAYMILDYQTLNTTVTVCSCYYTGLVQASRNVSAANWSGYEMDLARAAFDIVGQADTQMRFENINWVTGNCDYWELLFIELGTNGSYGTRPCDIVFGGTDQTVGRIKKNVIFSSATLSNGLKILVHVPSKSSLWIFLRPFTASLWLLMFATSIFTATVLWIFEIKMEYFSSRPKFITRKLESYLFSATGLMLQGIKDVKIKSSGSRLFTLCYCFLVLVLMNTYIAVFSSQLTSSALNKQIQGINDVIDMNVGIFDGDLTVTSRYQLSNAVRFQWNNQDDELNMIEALRNGDIDALLVDAAFADYYSTMTCDIYEVGDLVMPVDFSLSLAIDTPPSRIKAINKALVTLKQQGLHDSLYSSYLGAGLKARSACPSDKSYESLQVTQLKLTDMAGLWIFFGASAVLGLLVNIALWLAKIVLAARRARLDTDPASGPKFGSTKFKFFPADEDEMTMADAGTVEDMLEVMEAKVKNVDKRIHEYGDRINAALEGLNVKVKATKPTMIIETTIEIDEPPVAPPIPLISPSNLTFKTASSNRWAEKPSPSWSRSSRASRSSIKVNNRVCPDIEEGGPLGQAVDRRRRIADDPPAQTSEATLDNGADGLIIITGADHE